MKFEFISDKKLKVILIRDYEELINCREIKASKSVLILCGSIIEATLVEYFISSLPAKKNRNDILKMSLGELLEIAENENLISSKIKQLSSVIKDYRNLIHPGREIRKEEQFTNDDAELAFSLLCMTINSIEKKYSESIKYTAKDVFEKLKKDWRFLSIYEIILTKLNFTEREKLLKMFIDFEIKQKSNLEYFQLMNENSEYVPVKTTQLEDVKPYVKELKPLLRQETIKLYLNKLLHSITSGENVLILSLYNLFHEDLHHLKKDDQELIAIYMISFLESLTEDSFVLSSDRTFSTIGKYLNTKKGIEHLKRFCDFAIVNFFEKTIVSEMDVFEQIFNSLDSKIKAELTQYMENFLSPEKGVPPKYIIDGFVKEANKRNILKKKYNS